MKNLTYLSSKAVVHLLFIHCLLLLLLFVFLCWVLVLLWVLYVLFWFCNHPAGEERAGCFTFVVFGVLCF